MYFLLLLLEKVKIKGKIQISLVGKIWTIKKIIHILQEVIRLGSFSTIETFQDFKVKYVSI